MESKYYKPLLKRWWLLVAAVLIAVLSSVWVTRQQPLVYQAHVTLMVGNSVKNPNPNGNDLYLTQQLAATYADIVMREPMRIAVMKKLGMDWLPEYSAAVVPNTQLIGLAVSDTSPERAQAVANALATELIDLSPTGSDQEQQSRQAFINRQLDELEANIKQTRDEIAKKQAELAGLFSARQIADAQTQVSALQGKLGTLQSNYAALLANTQSGATNTLSIIEQASLPSTPIGPKKAMTIALAAILACVLAGSACYLLEYLDDTLHNAEDVQNVLHLSTLGTVPMMGKDLATQALQHATLSVEQEAYNVLRTNLQFTAVDSQLNVIVVTSPAPAEGKSLSAANLSIALAQAERKVILVDGDLRRPRQHHLFKLNNGVGLTTVMLQNRVDLEGVLQPTDIAGLRVLTTGPIPPNPVQLLSSKRMQEVLTAARACADVVVIDTPPVTAFADAALLSALADGVLLVIRVNHSTRAMAQRSFKALQQVNARVVGVLLNCIAAGKEYDYYHRYYRTNPERRSDADRQAVHPVKVAEVRQ